MKLHRWLCILACFPVAVSDQLQALTSSDSYVITSSAKVGLFEVSADMGILCIMLVTWHFLDKGFFCNLEHLA